MPELPEVETVVRGLQPLLLGRRLVRVIARRPDLRWPLPPDLGQRLTGATVTGLSRRAKYGLMETDRGDTLIINPGEACGWVFGACTGAVVDLQTKHVEFIKVEG